MGITLDIQAANAIFTLPRSDGYFEAEFGDYLTRLGQNRPVVMLAFPPKSAGTFFCAAVITAIGGQHVRAVHAQGGRDGVPYMPTFIFYYAGGYPASTLVTHIHMQALPANRRFVEAFNIRPIIMIRSIPDMLASYWDMLDAEPANPSNWLNSMLPPNYAELPSQRKADFLVDVLGPWYASYYATWMDYAAEAPGRVCALHFRHFRGDPAGALEVALRHLALERPREDCKRAIEDVEKDRSLYRYNRGEEGRGYLRFGPGHIARLARLLSYYPNLQRHTNELLPEKPQS
jgi:hypothetical protein